VRPDPLADPAPENNLTGRTSIYVADCPHLVDLRGLENLTVWDEMVLVRATALESLRGLVTSRENQSLDIHGAPNLRDLSSLGGTSRMARFVLEGSGLERFELEQPLSLDQLEFRSNPELVSLDGLQAVQSMEELVIYDDDRLEQLPELPYLKDLRSLSIHDNDVLRAVPAWINPDDADFLHPEGFEQPAEFSPPSFDLVEIYANPLLAELSLPTTFRYGGRVIIGDNASLTAVKLPFLARVDQLSISNNTALSQLDIPALERVDDLHVVNNPNLSPSLFQDVQSYSSDIRNDPDSAVP
jgi:hypothetical protein